AAGHDAARGRATGDRGRQHDPGCLPAAQQGRGRHAGELSMRIRERLHARMMRDIEQLEHRTLSLLADLWKRQPSYVMRNAVKRILVSGDQIVVFEGNDHELRAAMSRLAGRPRSRVTLAVAGGVSLCP